MLHGMMIVIIVIYLASTIEFLVEEHSSQTIIYLSELLEFSFLPKGHLDQHIL
jgi:Na+/H+ antiporter NhaC